MYKIFAIIGEAGSGKDTILRNVLSAHPGAHEIISCTTRPPRDGEKEGVNYHYMTGEEFGQLILENKMIEATCFNDWFYGTLLSSLDKDVVNIGVFNPSGVEAILADPRVEATVFYAATTDKIRLMRQLTREENPNVDEIIRRFKADKADFCDLDFAYVELPNNNLDELNDAVMKIGMSLGDVRTI